MADMTERQTPVLLISGPVGVGKSSVGDELSNLLERDETPHTFIDFDYLRHTYPRPAGDPWGNRLALQNLEALWSNAVRAGSLNLIIATVVEAQTFVDEVRAVIPDARVMTCQLSASVATLHARIRRREIGSGLAWHLDRAVQLAAILARDTAPCDLRIDADSGSVTEVARALADAMAWRR